MPGPLSSLRILDFTTLLPGPFGTLILADLGAEVLRIESPSRPDMIRALPPHVDGISACHGYLNRNKRSLAVDLKHPDGAAVIKRLAQDYDIVIEQFRPGVMDRLGVGYEALRAENPGLIYCAITGYGQTGPLRDRAGHDLNYLALAGILSYNGRRDTGPAPAAVQIADVAGGSCHAVMAILAAVIHRQRTGEGQFIDISMTDAAFSLQALSAPPALVGGAEPALEGNQLNGGSFYDCYETEDGRWLSVAGLEPQFFAQFCQAIGRPELTSLGLVTEPGVVAQLKAAIAEAIRTRSFADWQAVFATVDACVEPVLSFHEACQHPQLQAREMVVAVSGEGGRAQQQLASPFRFSVTPPRYDHAGRPLGADTDAALQEAGFSAADIARLRTAGAIM